MQGWVVLCWALLALVAADQCPDGGRCEEGQTCCSDPLSGYECCPLDQAECCADHTHCCPAGTLCHAATSSCVNTTSSVPWVERTAADRPGLSKSFRMLKTSHTGEEDDSVCPDETRCPAEFSCLRATTKFGCCPLTQGVPCSDGKHCCPEGHQCSANGRSCIRKERFSTVLCPDKVSECPDGTTCCQTLEGTWACCPLEKAVCCEDKTHCCPEGSTCDIQHNKCISSFTKKETPMWAKLPARIRADWENQNEGDQVTAKTVADEKAPKVTTVNSLPPAEKEVSKTPEGGDVPCDDKSACPDGTTCCKTTEGKWSCCPLPEAVCCDDHIHCCPKGHTCNLVAQTCDEDHQSSVPLVRKVPAVPRQDARARNVTCDSTHFCPDDSTCCKTKTGEWACCPLPQAVCCDDHEHCCPHGTTCDSASTGCNGPLGSTPMKKKMAAFSRPPVDAKTQSGDVPCDDKSACPDGTTCCKTTEGKWSCCPLPEAVCCDDHIHCCPKGHTCNLVAQTCDEDHQSSVPLVRKVPAVPRQDARARNVTCDSTHFCPDDSTCCKTKTGEWACCPLPQAVCCDDHEHCCPHGTTCDSASTGCNGHLGSTPMEKKMAAFSRPPVDAKTQSGDVPCDDKSACPDGTTCCKTTEGKWSCCPLPEAVCCDDHIHCCPKGHTCNLVAQTCDEDHQSSVPLVRKVPAVPRQDARARNVTCDSTHFCPDDSTCCKTKTGEWACCPLPQAVCCDDHEHCCPHGTTCDSASTGCNGPLGSTPMKKKMAAFSRPPVDAKTQSGDVPCDDKSACPDGTTCCKTTEGKWSCCPLPEAVCCDDHIHCCPKGHTCNLVAQTCDEDHQSSVPLVRKVPAVPRQDARARKVTCDSTHFCPDDSTCCKTKTGEWACCPLPQAVCCDDHEHCCPHGTTCDSASTGCNGPLGSTPMKKKMAAFSRPPVDATAHAEGRVQCDAHTSCPQATTCCFMSFLRKWGCCPLPEAVCCADGTHCCPAHYKCVESTHTCTKEEVTIPWYTKLPASTSNQAGLGAVQCDEESECPEGNTCCRLSTGEWGCCPLENAVCCPDGKHCCPHGSTCTSDSCQQAVPRQLEVVPLTPVYLPGRQPTPTPLKSRDVQCDEKFSCADGDTCCHTSPTSWACCPSPNAVCCSDMKHCCPTGYTCTSVGDCVQNQQHQWHQFQANKKGALIL